MTQEDIIQAAELLKDPANIPEYGHTNNLTNHIRCLHCSSPDVKTEWNLLQKNYDGKNSEILYRKQYELTYLNFRTPNKHWLKSDYFLIWNI